MDTSAHAEYLKIRLRDLLGKRELTLKNITDLTVELAKIIEHVDGVKGIQKRQAVCDALRSYALTSQSRDRAHLLPVVDRTLPAMIDAMIGLDVGNISIKVAKSCLGLWCPGI